MPGKSRRAGTSPRGARRTHLNLRACPHIALAIAFSVSLASAGSAQSRDSLDDDARIERLAALGRIWGLAKYFHPSLAEAGSADWDSALAETIPRVRAARTSAEFRAAVAAMLGTLADPLTRIEDTATGRTAPVRRPFAFHLTPDSILVVIAGSYYELFAPEVTARMAAARGAVARARGIVLDLRPLDGADPFGRIQLEAAFADLQRLLVTEPIVTPGQRRRVYYGYQSPNPFASGQYRTGMVMENGSRIVPSRGARAIPTVFVIDSAASLLSSALPLQATGRSLIVYSGDLGRHSIGETTVVPFGDGFVAQVRTSDPLLADGTRAWLMPDAIITSRPGATDVALDSAIALARSFAPSQVRRVRPPAVRVAHPERSYPEMRYPSVAYRLLAAVRAWNVIEHFYPYKQLLDTAWSDVLPGVIRDFEGARDAADYARAVTRLSVRLSDAHAYVAGASYRDAVIDEGYPPIRVRIVEGLPLVTRIFDSASARAAGISIGDVVETVDGVSALARIRALEQFISSSTPGARADVAALTFMNGRVGSQVRLGLQDARGQRKAARLERRREDVNTLYHRERAGDIVRILPGNVGYVDLDRLTLDMLDSMFQRIARTRAVIFDMRGYPTGTIWAIAPRLTDSARTVARLETPLVGHRSPAPSVETFYQTVEPAPPSLRYRGRVLMLMDERSVSQAEHTGLYLKAVSGATFVGSRTAGTNGEITTVSLPGGLTMGFSGQAVMFPDGRRLQRLGLMPDVEARPTVAGIRAGRDEVLEAALGAAGR